MSPLAVYAARGHGLEQGLKSLQKWFDRQDTWEPPGDPRTLMDNGPGAPFRQPWSEVQVPARPITQADLAALTERVRRRVNRRFRLKGGFSIDASVRITLIGPDGRITKVRYVLPRYSCKAPLAPHLTDCLGQAHGLGGDALEVVRDLRRVFDADEPAEAKHRLKDIVARYQKTAPQLAAWLEQAAPEAITMLMIPTAHRRRLRTANRLERLNKEIKRRTRIATLFPNEASLLRLASAVLSEISDDWEAERADLTMEAR